MAALTWREVSAPNFGTSNDLLRQANVSRDRAMAGLTDTLKNLETEQTNAANNNLLLRSSQIQDPNQLRNALTSGSLLQGVDPRKVDPRVLESVNNRVGQLLNQAATQQNIDTGAQNLSANKYKQTRLESENALEDAARGSVAQSLNITGPEANLSTEALQQLAKSRSGLVSDRLSQQGTVLMNEARAFNNRTAKRDDAADQEALAQVGGLLERNATTDDLRRDFEETPFASQQAKTKALKQLEQATGQRLYAPIDADVPAGTTKGGAPAGSGGVGQATSVVAQAALQDLGRRTSQNNSTGIVADIEKNLADTRSAPEVAKAISDNIPEAAQGTINGLITDAMSKYPGLSAADIGSAISRSTTGNFFGSTSIGDGVGIDRESFDAVLQDLDTGKADYNSAQNQRIRSAGSAISKADQNLVDAKAELSKVMRRAGSQTSIDTSRAEAKVDRMQKALDSAIERSKQEDFQPVRKPSSKAPKGQTVGEFLQQNRRRKPDQL